MTGGSIAISAEVRAAVQPEVVARLEDRAAGEFTCVSCQMAGSIALGDDVAVILFRHPDGRVIKFAHQGCLDSQVIQVDTPAIPRMEERATMTDLVTYCYLTRDANGQPVAGLVVEQDGGVEFLNEHGDSVNPWLASLLGSGWELSIDPTARPPKIPDYTLKTNRQAGTGHILHGTETFLDSLPEGDLDPWLAAAVRSQEITVYAGLNIGLNESEARLDKVAAGLAKAAAAGKLVAARIKVINHNTPRPKRSPMQKAAQNVADNLRTALDERVRPGGPGRLNELDELAPLPARPKLIPVEGGGMPLMIIDLKAPPELTAQADAVLQAVKAAGFREFTDWEGGPLPLPPESWPGAAWRDD